MSKSGHKKDRHGKGHQGVRWRAHLRRFPRPKEERLLQYDDMRKGIKPGDVLLFQGDRWLSRLIRRVTRGAYSHSALVMPAWKTRFLVMQAEVLGVEIAPASHAVDGYDGRVDWWALEESARNQLDLEEFLNALLEPVGKPYDFIGVLWLGFLKLLHLKARVSNRKRTSYFCSDYVAEVLRKGGVKKGGLDDANTVPSDFAECGLFVYKGTLHKKVQARMTAPSESPTGASVASAG